MLGQVVERLLQDAGHGYRLRLRHGRRFPLNFKAQHDLWLRLLQRVTQQFQRRHQAELIQRRRPQIACNCTDLADCVFDMTYRSLVVPGGGNSSTTREPGLDRQFGHRQPLTQTVMHFGGDATALDLLSNNQFPGHIPQLAVNVTREQRTLGRWACHQTRQSLVRIPHRAGP
jgi:hypothetical protein